MLNPVPFSRRMLMHLQQITCVSKREIDEIEQFFHLPQCFKLHRIIKPFPTYNKSAANKYWKLS